MGDFHLKDEITILDPESITLERNRFGDLTLKLGDETYEKVRIMRAFPLSFPEKYIVFRVRNEEIGLLEDAEKIADTSRQILEDELRKAYFIPRITRICSLEENHGASKWKVETDYGMREFDVRSRDDIKVLPPFRVLFRDADGNRYEIPDCRRLDPKSQSLLDSET